MANDTELNPGTGGDTIATDDIGGVKHQKVKVEFGAEDSATQVDAANPLPVEDTPNVISTNNSTTATLGIGASFTGTAEDVSSFASVAINIDASHDSSAMGMTFQFSSDGTNWDDIFPFTYTAVDGARRFQFPVSAQFFRVVYTNGGTGQTHFRLQTILHRGTIGTTIHRIDDVLVGDRSAELVRAVIAGEAPGGNFLNVGVSAGGNFKIDLEDIGGTAVDTDAGVAGAGTQRVILADDQPALLPSVIDSNNTTATPLGTSGVFTGTATDVTGYGSISIQVFADEVSATDGLAFEWSTDGTNWDVADAHDFPANTGQQFIIPRAAQFFRIVYTNGTTAQGAFRLKTILNRHIVNGTAKAIDGDIHNNDMAQFSRSLIVGEAPGGNFLNVGVTAGGNFKIDLEDIAGVAISTNTGVRDAGTQRVTIATDDLVPVTAASLPLPTGAATAAGQLPDGHNVTVDNATLVVDGSGVTQPVSAVALPLPTGAATAAGQLPDGHNVTVDNSVAAPANVRISDGTDTALVSGAGALIVDGSAITQPVSAASLPLPAGAATAANQLPDGHNVTVDNASITVDAGTGPFDVGGPVASNAPLTGNPLHTGARASTAAPTPVSADGDAVSAWADRRGALKGVMVDDAGVSCMDGTNNALQVNVVAGGGAGGTSSSFAAAFPATGTAAGWSDGTNMQGARVFDADTGGGSEYVPGAVLRVPASGGSIGASFATGVRDAGTQRVTIATDDVVPVAGPVASDAPLTGNPLHTGARASTAAPTPVSADGDAVGIWADRRGALKGVMVDDAGVSCMDGANNALQVNVVAGGGAGGTSSTFGAAFPGTGTAAGWSDGTNMQGARVFDVDSGAGSEYVPGANIRVSASGGSLEAAAGTGARTAGTLRVTVATDDLVPVSAASLPLPAGAATAANQLPDGHNVTVDNTVGAPANVQISDGTETALVTAAGALEVDGSGVTQPVSAASLPLPTGAATSANQLADNHQVTANAGTGDFLSIAAHTINEAFKEANAVGGQFDDTTTTVATEDNVAPVRITAQRAFHTNLRNVAGTEIATASDPLRTDPTGTTTQPVSAVSLPLPSGAATAANQLANGHDVTVDNAAGGAAVNVQDGGNSLTVDAVSLPLPTGAATSALQLAAGHTVTALGTAAHDAAISGNPVPVALRANLNEPTAVANGDATYAWGDLEGRQVVVLNHPAALAAATHGPDTTNVTASGDTALVAAPGASLSIYVTDFWISNNASAKIKAALRDGTTARWLGTLAADGGGVTGTFNPPWKLAANTALNGNLAATGDVDFNVQFYVSA